jgi:hypothetical protein
VADLGHSERDAVRSQMRRVIKHLLKLEYSPATEPRDGWKDIVADVRSGVEDKLSSSLRLDWETMLARLHVQVLPKARRALRRFGENAAASTLPSSCPYSRRHLPARMVSCQTARPLRRARLTAAAAEARVVV